MKYCLILMLVLCGCGDYPTPPAEAAPKPAPRFVEENSDRLPFRIYRDTRTGRIYLYDFNPNGGFTEVNDTPSSYEGNDR